MNKSNTLPCPSCGARDHALEIEYAHLKDSKLRLNEIAKLSNELFNQETRGDKIKWFDFAWRVYQLSQT